MLRKTPGKERIAFVASPAPEAREAWLLAYGTLAGAMKAAAYPAESTLPMAAETSDAQEAA